MITLGGILLGLINIALVVAILLAIGLIVLLFWTWADFPFDERLRRLYIIIVGLIALYMLVALLLGFPTWRIVGGHDDRPPIGGVVAEPRTRIIR